MNAGRNLAAFIAGAPSVPDEALAAARRAVLDTLGVILAGSREESSRIVAGWLGEGGGRGEATVLGHGFRAPAADAALANGVSAHALDFDDVSLPMRGHPSAPVLPALLAAAEKTARGGRDLLTAFVVGFEVEAKLGRAIGEQHYAAGWHATSTLGSLGAAAGAARLLGLDEERAQAALGIAASLAAGLRRNFGTMTKHLHVGNAARNGVLAAELAARGYTADSEALEGESGFLAVMSRGAVDPAPFDALGRPYEITSTGVAAKLYPCCYALHRSLDAVLELRARHTLEPDAVAEVRVEVNRGGLMPLRREPPATGLEAKFSMEYCLAAALVDGRVGLASFRDEAVPRPDVGDLMARVWAAEGSEPGAFPIGGYADVSIALRDGTERRLRVDTPRGDPTRPLSRDELADKFRNCATGVVAPEAAERAIALIEGLEREASLADLVETLSAP